MIELYELEIFLGCDVGELESKMLMIDRFKINQHKFNSLLELWAITTISLFF